LVKRIGIAVVGAGWMGNAHAQAYRQVPRMWPEAGIDPRLIAVADTELRAAQATAERWGFNRSTADWRDVVSDPSVDIVDITGPNSIHAEVAIAAARAGKHVACEKPLGRTLDEAKAIASEVRRAGVISQVGFNYRLVPAVQFCRNLIDAGRLGRVLHIQVSFLSDFGRDPEAPFSWRYDSAAAGVGSMSDLGSHVVEMAEGLGGTIAEVAATQACFVTSRPEGSATTSHFERASGGTDRKRLPVTTDDAFVASVRFASGALGVLDASRVVAGPKSSFVFGVYGSEGAARWDLERMNEIDLYLPDSEESSSGFRRVVSGPTHPDFGRFSPGPGVGLGWQDLKTIEAFRLLRAISGGEPTDADASRGVRVAAVVDAIRGASNTQAWVSVKQRED
jgi:predicted dehydrogenase